MKWTSIAALLPLMAAALLAGCGQMVRLADLNQLQASNIPEQRKASFYGTRNGTPRNAAAYLVGPADIVELATGPDARIAPISAACKKPCSCPTNSIPPEIYLAEPGQRVRVSVLALAHIGALRIDQTIVCMGEVLNKPWSTLQATLKPLGVEATLLPHEKQWAMPGDVVKIMAEYRFGLRQGSAPEPYTFAETSTKVDGGGRGHVPAFGPVQSELTDAEKAQARAAAPAAAVPDAAHQAQAPTTNPAAPQAAADTNAVDAKSPYGGLQLVAHQQAESAARRIAFWLPGQSLERQPTLDELERCLKAVSSSQKLPPLFSRCADLGIDEYRYPYLPIHNREVSYRFTVEQSVTIVLWDGRRLLRPYRSGQTVDEAAREVHREVFGREIGVDDNLFAAVDPHPAIRSGGEPPFYAPLGARPGAILDQVLLLPGDVVHLSRWEPRRPL